MGAHGAHIIPEGLPGEGNLLFFDNGGTAGYGEPNPAAPLTGFHNVKRDYSRVVEFNPVTKEIVWEYDWYKNHKGILGHHGFKFFSPFVSYAQRLPNGNTLITEGSDGRVFEVTKDHELVWEFISPYWGQKLPMNMVYRAYRVPYEWVPQLGKQEETPIDRIDVNASGSPVRAALATDDSEIASKVRATLPKGQCPLASLRGRS